MSHFSQNGTRSHTQTHTIWALCVKVRRKLFTFSSLKDCRHPLTASMCAVEPFSSSKCLFVFVPWISFNNFTWPVFEQRWKPKVVVAGSWPFESTQGTGWPSGKWLLTQTISNWVIHPRLIASHVNGYIVEAPNAHKTQLTTESQISTDLPSAKSWNKTRPKCKPSSRSQSVSGECSACCKTLWTWKQPMFVCSSFSPLLNK